MSIALFCRGCDGAFWTQPCEAPLPGAPSQMLLALSSGLVVAVWYHDPMHSSGYHSSLSMTHHLAQARLFSRRAFFALTSNGIMVLLALVACAPLPAAISPSEPPPPDAPLDVKIGQMLMVGFSGATIAADDPIMHDIHLRHLGGVILLDWVGNIQSPEQVIALVTTLQSAAATPLLIAIDQEGGLVSRLKENHGFAPTASHQYLGTMNDTSATHAYASTMAQTLAWLGINLNLAPVVDLNTNPYNPIIARYERSFSADPTIVTNQALAFIQAHHEQHVLCALKHFPGHGSSSQDSHVGLADVTATWSPDELQPYAAILQSGQTDVIMTAHVFNAALDANYPATLSQATIGGMLRGELGYDGVVMSDDMLMGAIRNYYGFELAIQRAIEAGVDILLFAHPDPDLTRRAHDYITWLVQNGVIGEDRITQSYQRIYRLKAQLVRTATTHDE